MEDRLSARVTFEAKRGWLTFCETHGVTFTGLMEAAGKLMDSGSMTMHSSEVIDLARKIDFERAKRR